MTICDIYYLVFFYIKNFTKIETNSFEPVHFLNQNFDILQRFVTKNKNFKFWTQKKMKKEMKKQKKK